MSTKRPNWLQIARDSLTEQQWRRIFEAAVAEAMNGDRYAREFVASFVVPKDRAESDDDTFAVVKLVRSEKPSEGGEEDGEG